MAYLLIVDDDTDGREVLCRFLEKSGQGHKVLCVSNGEEALSAILSDRPDLVVLDLFMPVMDGIMLLQILRSYLRLQKLPVIVLTALPGTPQAERAKLLNVNAVLVKGQASFNQILDVIERELILQG